MAEKRDATEFNNYEYAYSTRYRYRDTFANVHQNNGGVSTDSKESVSPKKINLKAPSLKSLSKNAKKLIRKMPMVTTMAELKDSLTYLKSVRDRITPKIYNYIVMNKVITDSLRKEFMKKVRLIPSVEYEAVQSVETVKKQPTKKQPSKKKKRTNSSHCGSTFASRNTGGVNIAQQLTYRNSVVRPDEEYEYGLSDW